MTWILHFHSLLHLLADFLLSKLLRVKSSISHLLIYLFSELFIVFLDIVDDFLVQRFEVDVEWEDVVLAQAFCIFCTSLYTVNPLPKRIVGASFTYVNKLSF